MMTLDKTELTLQHFCDDYKPLHRLVIGLTGNPGAGKTTVAELLKEKGAMIIDGDQLGYEMLLKTSPVYLKLIQTFGESVLNEDRDIDRSKLGAIVFQDQAKLDTLNHIVHPPMLQQIENRIQQFRDSNESGPLILDAALIYEWGIEDWMDVVIVVTAPKLLRHQRYIRYKGGDPEKLNKRETAQLPEEEKINRADILIFNDEGMDALPYKVNHIFQEKYQE